MNTDNEKIELEKYINCLDIRWKGVARTQYSKSISEGKTHNETMQDTLNRVNMVASKTLRRIDNL